MDMIHCAVDASMPKSAMMTGSAGDMTVWFSSAKNAPSTTTATMRTCTPVIFPLAGIEEVEDIGTPIVRP